jgi:hypothetical protein
MPITIEKPREYLMRAALQTTLVVLAVAAVGFAQDPAPRPATPARQPAPPGQDVLKKWVGQWDATVESTVRDGKLVTNPAKSTSRLAYGDRWLISDFDGTFLGAPFTGQEVLGYDPVAKKFLLNWIDSIATSFATGEGIFDPKTNTMTWTVSSRDDSTGKLTTWRQVDIWKDADHHDWSIRATKDGKEQIQMTIRYRRKAPRGSN